MTSKQISTGGGGGPNQSIMSIMGRLKNLNSHQLKMVDSKLSDVNKKFDITDPEMQKYLDKRIAQNKKNHEL